MDDGSDLFMLLLLICLIINMFNTNQLVKRSQPNLAAIRLKRRRNQLLARCRRKFVRARHIDKR